MIIWPGIPFAPVASGIIGPVNSITAGTIAFTNPVSIVGTNAAVGASSGAASAGLAAVLGPVAIAVAVLALGQLYNAIEAARIKRIRETNRARIKELDKHIAELEAQANVLSNQLQRDMNVASKTLNSRAVDFSFQLPDLQKSIALGTLPSMPTMSNNSPNNKTYKVRRGDSLSSIALRYDMAWEDLWNMNQSNLRSGDPNLIYPDEIIQLPNNAKVNPTVTKAVVQTNFKWSASTVNAHVYSPIVTNDPGFGIYSQKNIPINMNPIAETIIPKSFWEHGGFGTGYGAGLVDGLYQELKSLPEIIGVTIDIIKSIYNANYINIFEFIKNNPQEIIQALQEIMKSLGKEMENYWSEINGNNGSAEQGYEIGKLSIFILSLIVGLSELQAFVKAGKSSINMSKLLKKAAHKAKSMSQLSKKQIANKIKTISKVFKNKTTPSKKPNSYLKPKGNPEKIPLEGKPEHIRGIKRQNETADLYAKNGFETFHTPYSGTLKKPDLLIEGEIFDVYAPSTNNPRSIWSNVENKIRENQTKRIVVNLDDCTCTLEQVASQFRDWPIETMKELHFVKNGQIIPILPK